MGPMLMFPVQDPQTKQNAFVLRGPTTRPCANVRNTSESKKKLENYKFTGFCLDCVKGEGQASYQTWLDTGMQSIRGFNLTTFCAICHRRQIASRKMQSQARKPGKVQAANGVQHP